MGNTAAYNSDGNGFDFSEKVYTGEGGYVNVKGVYTEG